jgi:hypothetical protein
MRKPEQPPVAAGYRDHCGRRTVVQVTAGGWSSRCSRHGLVTDAR